MFPEVHDQVQTCSRSRKINRKKVTHFCRALSHTHTPILSRLIEDAFYLDTTYSNTHPIKVEKVLEEYVQYSQSWI